MKWKITSQYVISVMWIFFIVFILNISLFFFIVFQQTTSDSELKATVDYEQFVRSFASEIDVHNNLFSLSDKGRAALKEKEGALHILNDHGYVIASFESSTAIDSHFRPFDIIQNYKHMDDDLNLYFAGEVDGYSYIVTIPANEQSRVVFILNTSHAFHTLLKFSLFAIAANFIVSLLAGFIFSTVFTRPIYKIINRIRSFKNRVFVHEPIEKPGVFDAVFMNLNDVSDSLNEYEQKRKEIEQMRSEWMTNISHDIRTPLTSIIGYSDLYLLRSDKLSEDERRRYVDIIQRQAKYIQLLIDDLNLSERLRHKEITLNKQNINMVDFINNIVHDVANDPQFKNKQLYFDTELEELSCPIDPLLMKRAILNFIHNAFIHNEKVTVTVSLFENKLLITDNGTGIAEKDLKQIFKRHYRAASASKVPGSGLGMPIAANIIQAHNGEVHITSEVGCGTTIQITFE